MGVATIEVTRVLPNGDVVCDERSVEAFQERMARVCGTLNALHAELVEMIAEAIATDAWKQWGIGSIEQYVTWQTGLSAGRARQLVHARRHAELPETMARFGRGELTLDQVSVVVAHAPADVDGQVAGFATVATVSQLRSTLAKYSWKQAEDASAPPATDKDVASGGFDENGRYRLRVNAPAEVGVIIDAALREARDSLFRDGHPDVTWLDAVREMAERSLDTVTSPSRRERYRIYLHVDPSDSDNDGGPVAWFDNGPAAPAWVRDLICCDGTIRPLVVDNGIPVSVGRRQYIVPPHTRRVVLDRDRTCRHPGCTARTFLDVHHIREFLNGGSTDLDNLCALCPKHHAAYHRGDFTITGNPNLPDGLRFHDTRGRPIKPVGTPIRPNSPPMLTNQYVHPSGERLDRRWIYFHQN